MTVWIVFRAYEDREWYMHAEPLYVCLTPPAGMRTDIDPSNVPSEVKHDTHFCREYEVRP
jgi:hypothetical protein